MHGDRSGRGGLHAPEHGLHPCAEFARAERLHHVVVAADLQADHAIHFARACSEKNDRQIRRAADLAAQVEADDIRQSDIKDDERPRPARQGRARERCDLQHPDAWSHQSRSCYASMRSTHRSCRGTPSFLP